MKQPSPPPLSARFHSLRRWPLALGFALVLLALFNVGILPTPAVEAAPAAAPAASDSDTSVDVESVVSLLELIIDADADSAAHCLNMLADKLRSNEIDTKTLEQLRPRLETILKPLLESAAGEPLRVDAALLASYWKQPRAVEIVRGMLASSNLPQQQRVRALDALIAIQEPSALATASELLHGDATDERDLRGAMLASLGRSADPRVADVVLTVYSRMDGELRPKAIELLTQRSVWSIELLKAIGDKQIPAEALNANQVTRLQMSRDEGLRRLVANTWGTVRQTRNPQREQVIAEMRELLARTPGDAERGEVVFHKLCGQCHKMHGRGTEVGPDITLNGRSSYEQLLSNVFDPSLVIGAAYQARVVVTEDGRVLTGLLAEESEARVVLKLQGGKQEVIPRDEIDEISTSQLSMMPEGLENQLMPVELADLFAFLTLDRPPSDPDAKPIPGTPEPVR